MDRQLRLRTVLRALVKIDEQLDIIDYNDPYGDMVENFCDLEKDQRVTKRLIKMVGEDIKSYRKESI